MRRWCGRRARWCRDRGLFARVRGNPVAANIEDGLAAYRAGGHDGVIAFGGGSALDAGKVIAFMSGQTRPLWDFEDVGDWWTRADRRGIAPVVAVPTTAGTGSEVGSRRRRHQRGDAPEEDHLPSADDARRRDQRSGAHGRPAAGDHRGDRHRCLRALLRGLLRAGIPSAGRRHRARGHAADPDLPAAGLRERHATSRRARACWRRPAWAPRPFRKGWAACTRSRTRSARTSTRIMD